MNLQRRDFLRNGSKRREKMAQKGRKKKKKKKIQLFYPFSLIQSQDSASMKRRVRRMFTFNVMVVGASGLGKTTFVRTLMAETKFNFDVPPQKQDGATLSIEVYTSGKPFFFLLLDLLRKKLLIF